VSPAVRGATRALATAAVVVVIDQVTKQIVVSSLEPGHSASVFFGLDISNTRNTGVAFGAFRGGGLVVGVLIALSLVLLLGYFAFHAASPGLWLPVGMLVGGALGNLADRARDGAVIDFIDPVAWPAFNLADASIVLGVLLLLYAVESARSRT
jgi:signal peptidase II